MGILQLHSTLMLHGTVCTLPGKIGGSHLVVRHAVGDDSVNSPKFELVPWQNRVPVSFGLQHSEATCPAQQGLQEKHTALGSTQLCVPACAATVQAGLQEGEHVQEQADLVSTSCILDPTNSSSTLQVCKR